jgi:hypothetical protein
MRYISSNLSQTSDLAIKHACISYTIFMRLVISRWEQVGACGSTHYEQVRYQPHVLASVPRYLLLNNLRLVGTH